MPIAPPSNNWLVGLAKQTAEGTVPTTAEYAFPVFSGRPLPVHDQDRVAVTDAASIQGDAYFQAGEYWTADVTLPTFSDTTGRILTGFWPTDTPTGTAPTRSHVYTGFGTQPLFWTMWSLPGGSLALPESMSKGICSGITFSFDENGGPLQTEVTATGQVPAVVTTPTITVTNAITAGYFRTVGAVLKFEEDSATPVAQTNIQQCSLKVSRDVTPMKTADGVNVAYLAQGLVAIELTFQLVWANWDAYRASYYGAVAGSAASSTMVAGSVELNFVHTVEVSTFKLVVPKVALIADPPEPNPDGSPLTVNINAQVLKPAAGEHVQPTLINNVTPAY